MFFYFKESIPVEGDALTRQWWQCRQITASVKGMHMSGRQVSLYSGWNGAIRVTMKVLFFHENYCDKYCKKMI